MSYEYLMFKASAPIKSMNDLSEETVELQDPAGLMKQLSAILPALSWTRVDGSFWEALCDDGAARYEFRIPLTPKQSWRVHTSHRVTARPLVPILCSKMGLVAFDGQAMTLIDKDGERPA
jgi:hypothetical protein